MPIMTKRKATSTIEESKETRPAKRTCRPGTLDAFFTGPPRKGEAQLEQRGTIHKSTASERRAPQGVALSDEQAEVLRMVVDDGKNVFFTGSAGTGKSLLLRAIIEVLRKKYAKTSECLAVCASTGMAAQNIGGTTIHAWGAVAPNVHDIGKLMSYIKTCRPALRRWKQTRVLIIDEVSMVDGQLFDTLATLATALRKTDRPFGGIQLVVSGDFFQLPPCVTQAGKDAFFAFQSRAWKSCIQHTVTLTQVFRQKDSHFISLLNAMRQGEISTAARHTLMRLSRPLTQDDGILPTELYPLRADVDRANASRMTALTGPAYRFEARDTGSAAPDKRRRLLDNMTAVKTLELKVDAQVMLVKNVSETLVNGSVGRVLGFEKEKPMNAGRQKVRDDDELLPLVEFGTFRGKETMLVSRDEFRAEDSEGNLLARRIQLPLVLAWAMSIHKSQGQTIQRVKVDLNKVFEKGQSYVALSRAATLEGLQVIGFDTRKVVAHPRVIEWSASTANNRG